MIRIKRRTMCIPKEEAYIGTVDDSNAESRIFQIERYTESQSDIGNLTFKLITINEKGKENPIYLTKAVDESHVFLTWTIIGSDIEASGTLLVQIKAFDEQGMVRWNSFIGSFYIEENLNMPDVSTEKLSDYELLLSKVTKAYGMLEGSIIESIDQSGEKLIITFADGTKKEFNIGGDISQEKISEAVNAYLTANPMEEKDPTVPDWAKSPKKPTYTASEVGALPDSTNIPSSPGDVGADPAGTAESKVSVHNTSVDAHNDIRLLIEGLTSRLNALADSDDTTLDQMSEIVAYIKSNKRLIDAITTGKVSTSDIVDNLTTNAANRPLSAAQGVVLKAMIDGIAIPSNTSDLTNDSGFVELDDSLTDNTKAAPAGIVGEIKGDIEQLKQNGTSAGSGVTVAQSNSLWAIIQKAAFTEVLTDEELNAFKSAWGIEESGSDGPTTPPTEEPEAPTLTSITVTWSSDSADVGTDPKTLISVVKANYSDGTSRTVTGYTVTPSALAEGANTVTVSYSGKTSTKTITGNAIVVPDEPTVSDNLIVLSECGSGTLKDGSSANGVDMLVTPYIKVDPTKLYYTNINKTLNDGTNIWNQKLELYTADQARIRTIQLNYNNDYGVITEIPNIKDDSAEYVRILFNVKNDNPYFGESGVV